MRIRGVVASLVALLLVAGAAEAGALERRAHRLDITVRPSVVRVGDDVHVRAVFDGAPTRLAVDFGDGSRPRAMPQRSDGETTVGRSSHAYDSPGTYRVTVTATPARGEPLTASAEVRVGAERRDDRRPDRADRRPDRGAPPRRAASAAR